MLFNRLIGGFFVCKNMNDMKHHESLSRNMAKIRNANYCRANLNMTLPQGYLGQLLSGNINGDFTPIEHFILVSVSSFNFKYYPDKFILETALILSKPAFIK